MEKQQLVEQWRSCSLQVPPYLFPGDEFLADDSIEPHRSFDEFIASEDLGLTSSGKLHLGLLPLPYIGNLERSSVFILMVNPGISPDDYWAEQHDKEYRAALVRNLRQENADDTYPFVFLNPCFSWHAGFRYWQRKFHSIARELTNRLHVQYQDALSILAQSVCCLQLVPYHSQSFRLPNKILERLSSVRIITQYARNVLVPRAQSGEAVIVVARKEDRWGLEQQDNVVVYKGSETRAAYLTLKNRGGSAIFEHLMRNFDGK